MVDLIRRLIGDEPKIYEDSFSVNSANIISFAHYPVIEATILLDGVVVTGTLNNEAGYFESDAPMTGTIYTKYKTVWFTDQTINAMSSYRKITTNLLSIGNNQYVMPIPYYPVNFEETHGYTLTYDDVSNTFTCNDGYPQVSGTFLDIYTTAGTLLLLKASMPERIRREFASFSNWGDYPQVATGLQNQAMAWFKMSGVE